jgi:uncharacterized metal-binding protein YceD (DUF177 family)
MGYSRDFEIAFVGLKPGTHEYDYEITDRFFEAFQEQDFKNCHANIKLTLDKKNSFMQLKFEIGGKLESNCDRCGNPLAVDLWDEFNIIVKLVEEPEMMNDQEGDPDVYYIGRNESHLDVASWIYEFINLSLPMQKVCGQFDNGKTTCNADVLEMLNTLEPEQEQEEKEEDKTNPIWKDLEKFKDLGNN